MRCPCPPFVSVSSVVAHSLGKATTEDTGIERRALPYFRVRSRIQNIAVPSGVLRSASFFNSPAATS